MCGEKHFGGKRQRLAPGSPPRVRGKEHFSKAKGAALGITPACAGKRQAFGEVEAKNEDHPRVCGEKSLSAKIEFLRWGSPPRVRGKD